MSYMYVHNIHDNNDIVHVLTCSPSIAHMLSVAYMQVPRRGGSGVGQKAPPQNGVGRGWPESLRAKKWGGRC